MIELPVHPGPVATERVTSVEGSYVRMRTRLTSADASETGAPVSVMDALTRAVRAAGSDYGFVEIGTGPLARVEYCYPAYGDETHPMLYSATHVSEHATALFGAATVGERVVPDGAAPEARERWSHIHLMWADADGSVRGGHLWPETVVDGDGPEVLVYAVHGFSLVNARDPETQLPVFGGHTEPGPQAGDGRILFARVAPNIELAEAIVEVCRRHGVRRARPVAGTGSFVGVTLADRTTGETIEVPGPALEVMRLSGTIDLDGPADAQVVLEMSAVDGRGAVHSGRLAQAGNPVGATFDLALVVE